MTTLLDRAPAISFFGFFAKKESGFRIFGAEDLDFSQNTENGEEFHNFTKIAISAPPSPEPYRTCRFLRLLGSEFAKRAHFSDLALLIPKLPKIGNCQKDAHSEDSGTILRFLHIFSFPTHGGDPPQRRNFPRPPPYEMGGGRNFSREACFAPPTPMILMNFSEILNFHTFCSFCVIIHFLRLFALFGTFCTFPLFLHIL